VRTRLSTLLPYTTLFRSLVFLPAHRGPELRWSVVPLDRLSGGRDHVRRPDRVDQSGARRAGAHAHPPAIAGMTVTSSPSWTGAEIGRAHVCTPVTRSYRMPSSA